MAPRPPSPRRQIWEAAQRVTLGEVYSNKHIEAKVLEHEQAMSELWYPEETDFSFYSDPNYVWLLLGSWSVRSAQDTDFLLRNRIFMSDPKSIVDFHGGMGLTCMRLAMAYPEAKVYSHTEVQQHADWCSAIAKELGLTNVFPTDKLLSADILIAQETMEHIKDPFSTMETMLDTVQPKQYLDGTSFTIDSPGHFRTYTDARPHLTSGALTAAAPLTIDRRKAKTRMYNLIRARGYEEYWKRDPSLKKPFNGRPVLFQGPKQV